MYMEYGKMVLMNPFAGRNRNTDREQTCRQQGKERVGGKFKKEGTCVYLWLIHYGGMLETNRAL